MKRKEDGKTTSQKLKINRETLRILTRGQLEAVHGGARPETSGASGGVGCSSGDPMICGAQSGKNPGQCH